MKIPRTAPQTAQIPLAKQQPARVQLHRPDFDNGMKTVFSLCFYTTLLLLHRPDFDNGMKTPPLLSLRKGIFPLHRPDFDNGMKTYIFLGERQQNRVAPPGF
ncbi:hypothetical protein [Methylobacter tundripaludum]|uniref:hypothetical protein n=1 Tax=Methylobacter tundripaludum TaxID=173365 RepID=UPI0039913C14